MDSKEAFFDFHRDKNLDMQSPEDSVATDFTLVTSCVYSKEAAKAKKLKTDLVKEFIATERNKPSSVKQKILNFINLK